MKGSQKRHQRRANKRASKRVVQEASHTETKTHTDKTPVVTSRNQVQLPDVSKLTSRDPAELLALWWSPNPVDRQRVTLGAIVDSIRNFERDYLKTSRAAAKANKPVDNPGLIDVWRHHSTFVLAPITPEEASWGHLCFSPVTPRPSCEEPFSFPMLKSYLQGREEDGSSSKSENTVSMHCGSAASSSPSKKGVCALPDSVHDVICSYALPASVVDRDTFLRRFHVFTSGQFEGWTGWDNMLVIGGAVVGCLLPFEQEPRDLHDYYFSQNDCWTSSDIDVYFWGLTNEQFGQKIFELYQHLIKRNGKVAVMRTPFTVTFVSDYPARNIQIVLGRWASQAQVLFEPDVDCSAVGFDGTRVLATERSRMSYNHRWLLTSQERYDLRGFPEYEERLYKYSRRGFAVVDRELEGDFSNVSAKHMDIGVERLMEHKAVRGRADINGLRLLYVAAHNPEIREQIDLFKIEKYKSSGIPYGPEWSVDAVCQKMMEPVYETTHYGPYQVPSRFVVLKAEMEPDPKAEGVPPELCLRKHPYDGKWYQTDEERTKAAEERSKPQNVATKEYFTREISLVNMEEEPNSTPSYERRKRQWNAHCFKYQDELEIARENKRRERIKKRYLLYLEQCEQCLKEGYCLTSVAQAFDYDNELKPNAPVALCPTCKNHLCKPCYLKKCHDCPPFDFDAAVSNSLGYTPWCLCNQRPNCPARRPEPYAVPRNLDYSSDEE